MKETTDKTGSTQVVETFSIEGQFLDEIIDEIKEIKRIVDYALPAPHFPEVRAPLPIKTIADPGYVIKEMIERKIDNLSLISDAIKLIMEETPKIKDAAVADVRSRTWNDFRRVRQRWINKSNIEYWAEYKRQKPEKPDAFSPAALSPVFPMVIFSNCSDLSNFRIIRDDCNDMVKFINNAKQMTPHFLLYLFSRIFEIEHKYYYLIGFHRMKYERSQIYKNGPGAMSREVGKQTIQRTLKVLEKYGGITGYTKLERGRKKIVRAEIQKTCHFAEDRQVYRILRVIKGL